jgi:hypothetical protein
MAESESGLNSNAVGRPNRDNSRDYGIFQVRTQFSRYWNVVNIFILIELLFINPNLIITPLRVKQYRHHSGSVLFPIDLSHSIQWYITYTVEKTLLNKLRQINNKCNLENKKCIPNFCLSSSREETIWES